MINMADPTAITKSTMAAFNTAYELKTTAATADVDGTAEVFSFTPTRQRGLLIIDLVGPAVATAGEDVAVSVAAGTLWAAKAITATATKAKITVIEVETAAVKGAAGVITVTLTPDEADKLKSDHLCKVSYVELI
jgi:hypothetical protein